MAFARHEKKYICTPQTIKIMHSRLKGLLKPDPHTNFGAYTVYSLYFDSNINISAAENDAGDIKRAKYRIRYYNALEGLKLEKKQKINGLTQKDSVPITHKQAESLISGDVAKLLHSKEPLLKEMAIKIATQHFTPKVIVAYTRYPFVCPTSDIRVTLDTNICCSYQTDRFLNRSFARIPLAATASDIMEVKFNQVLPSYIKMALSDDSLIQSTFSKYYLARKRAAEIGR
ncbi:MAG: polyphosphate polymerase domain-containing protein [Clostridia bacterium]|nr:polyphosphate polymerase domain-containing protein [Clostridia bacterium]